MHHVTKKLFGTSAALALCGLVANPAEAQDTSAAVPAAEPAQLADIVVTAQRRKESAQKTPLSITALSGDQLARQNIRSATDLTGIVPGVQIGSTEGSVEINIRGIGSTNNTEVGDPAVAFNLNGIYLGRPREAGTAFYDVDRIEVLRGPQGTLYGRNATAGAINVITNRPTDKWEGDVNLEAGNYGLIRGGGAVNIPITDTLAVRGAFQMSHRDSYNKGLNNDYGNEAVASGRLSVQWKPTDRLTVLVVGDYYHNGGSGSAPSAPIGTWKAYADPYRFDVSAPGYQNYRDYGVTAQIDYDLGFATLTYLGSYRKDHLNLDWGYTQNYAVGTQPTAGECDPQTDGPGCYYIIANNRAKQWSNEVRLGHSSGKLKWTIGLYQFEEKQSTEATFVGAIAFIQPDILSKSKAAFGQLTYSLTDRFRVTGGLRYTEDTKARNGGTYLNIDSNFNCTAAGGLNTSIYAETPGCLLTPNIASFTWHAVNYKGGVEYDITPSSMFYADTATAYKAGGYGDGVAPNNRRYNPEHLTAYEAGIKNRFFDNRVQANFTGFYYKYRDFQVSGVDVIAGQNVSRTLNAQKAQLYGGEFEGTALISPVDRIDLSAAFLHARYKKFVLENGDNFNSGYVDLSGNTLARSPKWTINAGYEHYFDLANGGRIIARAQTRYTTAQFLEYHNYAVSRQGDYTKTDLTLTYQLPGRAVSIMAYVRNLENKAVLTRAVPDSSSIDFAGGSGTYAPPRTFGMQLTGHF